MFFIFGNLNKRLARAYAEGELHPTKTRVKNCVS